MDKSAAALEIETIIIAELDDCERAIRNDDKAKALRELADVVSRLKHLAGQLRS